ncbi:MAG: hypothetical protein EBY17_14185 [Acidobacteriia bacterium]|nr:hypothetical protein [Terriglobia bacterium]
MGMALTVIAQQPVMQEHPEAYPKADIQYGARLYGEHCDRCHGANGAGVSGVNLASGKFRSATTDGQLKMVITNGFPTAGMPPFRFDTADLTGLVAWLRNMNSIDRGSMKAGDPARGRAIFEGKAACGSCHRVNGKGSRKGPDLSDIGTLRSAGYFERILVDPNGQLLPINRPVHVVTREGKAVDGRRLNEDTYTVQMVDGEGHLQSFVKANLREFRISTKSAMTSYRGELQPDELADLVAYMLTLKGVL